MLEEELLYVLALQRVKGIGDINAKKLISNPICPEVKAKLSKLNQTQGFQNKRAFQMR